jgi:hypothetical protein
MVKLIPEDDFKDDNCALKLVNKELEQGVAKARVDSESVDSSSVEDSPSSSS